MGAPFVTCLLSFSTYISTTGIAMLALRRYSVLPDGHTRITPDLSLKWSMSVSSLLHAIVMTIVGVSVTVFEDWSVKSLIHGRSQLLPTFMAWELGYLAQDLLAMSYSKLKYAHWAGWSLAFHHVFLLCGLPWYFRVQLGDYFWGALFS